MTDLFTVIDRLRGRWVRLLGTPRIRGGAGLRVRGRVIVHGGGQVVLGDSVELDGRAAPIELHVAPGATLTLGDRVRLEGGVSIEALQGVVVGEGTRMQGFSKVLDSHFHPLTGPRHGERPVPVPVVIGKGCTVGWRAILLPGARLGDGVSVLATTTISREFPAGVVVGGSPPMVREAREGSLS